MAIPLSYNVRNVLQRPVSTLTTAVGVALTVMIFIGALALANGVHAALVKTGSAQNAIVLRKGADSELSSGVAIDAANIIRANPAVATGADGRAIASSDIVVVVNKPRLGQPGSSNVQVRGVSGTVATLRPDVKIVSGRMFTPGTDEVIVGQRIARRFANCNVGDKILFQRREFTVVGQFDAAGSAFESEIWGDAAVLGPALDREGAYQSLTLRMKDPSKFDALKAELEADPRLQVQVKREDRFYSDQSELLTNTIRIAGVLITVIMAVGAVFGAMNTMYAAVQQRTREIAVLFVLGFGRFAVMTSFLFESIFLSIIGGVIGCLLALPINGITTSTTNFQSFSELAFGFRVTPDALVAGLIFSALMGFAGGLLPAFHASRQSLAASLRQG
jgi:ABC-type lipoprotein release transport system permease subunit